MNHGSGGRPGKGGRQVTEDEADLWRQLAPPGVRGLFLLGAGGPAAHPAPDAMVCLCPDLDAASVNRLANQGC